MGPPPPEQRTEPEGAATYDDDNEPLTPDTFWELVEKLLLTSTSDEKRRLRHNAALGALCRGRALAYVPREQKESINAFKSYINENRRREPKSACNSGKSHLNDNHRREPKSACNSVARKSYKDKTEKIVAESIVQEEINKSKRENTIDIPVEDQDDAIEISIDDSPIAYAKDDVYVPMNERLWRFALRNRKLREDAEKTALNLPADDDEDEGIIQDDCPTARTNEAVYQGLQKNINEAKSILKETKTGSAKVSVTCPDLQVQTSENQPLLKNRKQRENQPLRNLSFTRIKLQKLAKERKKTKPIVVPTSTSYCKPEQDNLGHDNCEALIKNLIESSEDAGKVEIDNKINFDTKKNQYDKVLRRRLHCGSRLESLNKEIVNKKLNPRTTLSRETMKRYTELKSEYLKLCYQESSLRHQIAVLQAQIYMMQNKAYHKQPATVKTITLDGSSTNLDNNDVNGDVKPQNVMLFPSLKAPRPLIIPNKQQRSIEKWEASMGRFGDGHMPKKTASEPNGLHGSSEGVPPRGICSLYSISSDLKPPPKLTVPTMLKSQDTIRHKIPHRLPRVVTVVDSSIYT